MRPCSGPLLGVLLLIAAPAPGRAQGEPVPVQGTTGEPASQRALAGHLFVPSHLVQDPFSYTGVGLFWGVGGGSASGPTLDLGLPPRIDFVNTRDHGFQGELAAGTEIDWRLGRLASQHVASFTTAWVNLKYYWNAR